MRKFIALTLLISLISTNTVFANGNIPVYYDNIQLNLSKSPVVKNGTLLVPFRDIFETLGFSVYYDGAYQSIVGKKNGEIIILLIGSKYANVSGVDHSLSVAPEIINCATMVPLRFVSEAAGCTVEWSNDNNYSHIKITTKEIANTSTNTNTVQNVTQKTPSYQEKRKAIFDKHHETWVSKDNLNNIHHIYATWLGDYIAFIDGPTSKEIFRISGSPEKEFEKGKIYYGNGVHYQYVNTISYPFPEAQDGSGKIDIRVDGLLFSVPDLKAQRVIE